jgi:transcriptional regulator NrdR family protein
MAQATVSRRRPCRQCGGRYFVSTVNIAAAIVATAAVLGGFAMAFLNSGVLNVMNGRAMDPASADTSGLDISAGLWAVAGMIVAVVVAWLGHGYRCIKCDAHQ